MALITGTALSELSQAQVTSNRVQVLSSRHNVLLVTEPLATQEKWVDGIKTHRCFCFMSFMPRAGKSRHLVTSKSSFLKTLIFAITTILITGSIWQPPLRGEQGKFCYNFLCTYLFHQCYVQFSWPCFILLCIGCSRTESLGSENFTTISEDPMVQCLATSKGTTTIWRYGRERSG